MTPSSRPSVAARRPADPPLRERAGRRLQASARQASGIKAYALEMGFVEGMHPVIHHRRSAVIVEGQPIGLDDDARILEDLLEVFHDDLAVLRIGGGQRLLELGV